MNQTIYKFWIPVSTGQVGYHKIEGIRLIRIAWPFWIVRPAVGATLPRLVWLLFDFVAI